MDSKFGKDVSSAKGIDVFLRSMGTKVCDMDGNDVNLSEYVEGEFATTQNGNIKKIHKGKRELHNLEWDMKDGGATTSSASTKRQVKKKDIVTQIMSWNVRGLGGVEKMRKVKECIVKFFLMNKNALLNLN